MGDEITLTRLLDKESIQDGCTIYRGHLKLALLRCMSEKDMHGLDMINRIKEVTSGEWAPSPGSVYPLLRVFEKNGLVNKKQKGRSIIYSLTEDGRSVLGSLFKELKQQLHFMDWIMKLEQ